MVERSGDDGSWMSPMLEAAREFGVSLPTDVVPPVHERVTTRSGLGLHMLRWGHEGNSPMLCLHGGGQQCHSWDFWSLAASERFCVRSLDLRGHGDSDWSPETDYRIGSLATDVHDAIVDLGIAPVVLVGMSMGGLTAMLTAGTWPELVASLVVVDISYDVAPDGAQEMLQFMARPDRFDDIEELVNVVHMYNPRRPKHQLRSSLLHNLRQQKDGSWTWKYDRFFRQGGHGESELIDTAALASAAGRVAAPSLIVRGAESRMLTQAAAERLLATMPNAELVVVPEAGHSVMGDNPVAFERAVAEWLSTTEAARARSV